MSDVLAIAEVAMRNSVAALDSVSRNVANTGTPAFKRELWVQRSFDTHLQGGRPRPPDPARDWSAGPMQFTGVPLNFAIEGSGWFQLRSPQGVVLTRNGAFRTDRDGRLVSQHGWPVVLDADASIPSGTLTLKVDNELWVDDVRVGRFLLTDAQGQALQAAGPGVYRSRGLQLSETTGTVVRQGYLEGSNVNSLNEMVLLIEVMRQAEAAQRMMRAYDEALGTALTTLGEF